MNNAPALAPDIRRRLAVNVRKLRTNADRTIKQAAARAELHWRHWQKIEAGQNNATMATLIRVAVALDVDPADLLSEHPLALQVKKEEEEAVAAE